MVLINSDVRCVKTLTEVNKALSLKRDLKEKKIVVVMNSKASQRNKSTKATLLQGNDDLK